MATLGGILELYVNGALSIKYDKNLGVGTLGGVSITEEQAKNICMQLGWTAIYLHPFEIIEKTGKFIKAFKNCENIGELNNVAVDFQNNRSNEYGKTFDRIHIEYPRKFNLSILYGMAGNDSPYVVYDSFTSVPIKKCRNMKQVVECIDSKF